MQSLYDYKQFAILYVDDEELSLKMFQRAFGDQFRILTATNARDGFRILETQVEEIGLILTDQRMPGEQGVQLLEKARQLRPRIIRLLVTAYADLDATIAAVNSGAIYKYVTKPWDPPLLETTLKRGLEFFLVQRERDQLLSEKLSALHKLMITDRVISLGVLASGLGHHVRNALVAVQTFLELAPEMLAREELDVEELRHPNFWQGFHEKVQGRVRHIVGLLDCLREASDRPGFHFDTKVALASMVHRAVEETQRDFAARGIELLVQVPDDLPELSVDMAKFSHLFVLLLRDEAISLPERSRVALSAQAKGVGSSTPAIEVRLEDNGPGLPQKALRAVFDPFYVRADDPQEFGLNLMACYFIVYHHGGQMRVESPPGKGVTFILTLPLQPQTENLAAQDRDFMTRVMMNERLWERLMASA